MMEIYIDEVLGVILGGLLNTILDFFRDSSKQYLDEFFAVYLEDSLKTSLDELLG